jgi:hypothetical protein
MRKEVAPGDKVRLLLHWIPSAGQLENLSSQARFSESSNCLATCI